MRFSKWHALGNSYLVVERAGLEEPLTPDLVRHACDPHTGIGSDGLLEIVEVEGPEARVEVWNPDGSQAEVSGNGARIAALWLARRSGVAFVRIRIGDRRLPARVVGGGDRDRSRRGRGRPSRVARRRRRAPGVHARLGREPARGHPPRRDPRGAAAPRPARRDARALSTPHERAARPRRRSERPQHSRLGARGGGDASLGLERRRGSGSRGRPRLVRRPGTRTAARAARSIVELREGRAILTGPAEEICRGELVAP